MPAYLAQERSWRRDVTQVTKTHLAPGALRGYNFAMTLTMTPSRLSRLANLAIAFELRAFGGDIRAMLSDIRESMIALDYDNFDMIDSMIDDNSDGDYAPFFAYLQTHPDLPTIIEYLADILADNLA